MKAPIYPSKPYLLVQEPKEYYQKANYLENNDYSSGNLMDVLNNFCKDNKIKLEDLHLSNDSYYDEECSHDNLWNIYYNTPILNKTYKSDLKRYNKAKLQFDKEMIIFNKLLKQYEEELELYQINQAKKVLADHKKKYKTPP